MSVTPVLLNVRFEVSHQLFDSREIVPLLARAVVSVAMLRYIFHLELSNLRSNLQAQ